MSVIAVNKVKKRFLARLEAKTSWGRLVLKDIMQEVCDEVLEEEEHLTLLEDNDEESKTS